MPNICSPIVFLFSTKLFQKHVSTPFSVLFDDYAMYSCGDISHPALAGAIVNDRYRSGSHEPFSPILEDGTVVILKMFEFS